jgi:hypothetical protein
MNNTASVISDQPAKYPSPPIMTMIDDVGKRILPNNLNRIGTNPE